MGCTIICVPCLTRIEEPGVKGEIAVTETIGITLYRVGLVLMMCGILVGLIFSEWTPILIVGITFILPEITRRLIENRRVELRQENISTDVFS